jgi:uncharacterized protein
VRGLVAANSASVVAGASAAGGIHFRFVPVHFAASRVACSGKERTSVSERRRLKFSRLQEPYAVVKLRSEEAIPDWAIGGEFTSITRTAEELSIVCPAGNVPARVTSPHRWICWKLLGPFPFSQTGVLLSFVEPLSTSGVPIFAISTYDTDYVLIQEEFAQTALNLLEAAGHELAGSGGQG